jgi:hypothetical protein
MVTDLTCLARPCWSIDVNTHSPDRQAADGRQSDLTLSIGAKKSATSAKQVQTGITLKHLAAALSTVTTYRRGRRRACWAIW